MAMTSAGRRSGRNAQTKAAMPETAPAATDVPVSTSVPSVPVGEVQQKPKSPAHCVTETLRTATWAAGATRRGMPALRLTASVRSLPSTAPTAWTRGS